LLAWLGGHKNKNTMSIFNDPVRIVIVPLAIILSIWASHVHSFSDGNGIRISVLKYGYKNGVVHHMSRKENENTFVSNIKNFFKELDNFVDDATARRLGNGSAFYGKRKSNFYGENDANKKQSDGFDPQEDYRGPDSSGFFKWVEDEETGQMIPVSRMKYKNLEKRIPSDAEETEE
jgi:hypothetical protein